MIGYCSQTVMRLLLALALLLLATPLWCDPPGAENRPLLNARQVAWLEAHPVLRIGIPQSRPPLFSHGADGELGGTEVRYARLVAAKLGLNLQLETGPREKLQADLNAGRLDALAMASPDVEDATLRYSQPYAFLPYALFARRDDASLKDINSLEQKRVVLLDGEHYPYRLLEQVDRFTPVPASNLEQAMRLVTEGRADAFLAPLPVGLQAMHDEPDRALRVVDVLRGHPRKLAYAVDAENIMLDNVLSAAISAVSPQEHRDMRSAWADVRDHGPESESIALTTGERAWLQQHPELKMAVRAQWPPFEFIQNGQIQGLVPDLVHALEQQLGYSFDIQRLEDWTEAEQMLEDGSVDVIPAMPRTPRREGRFLFTRTYLTLPIVLVGREGGRFVGDLRELDNEAVGVVRGQAPHEFLLINHPNLNIQPVDSLREGLLALSNGDLDVMVTHIPGVSYNVSRLGLSNLRITSITPYQYELRLAVRKDMPELVGILNKALSNVDKPDHDLIYNRWIHLDMEQDTDYTVLRRVILVAIVVVAAFFYWNRKLSREVDERIRSEERLKQSEDALRSAKQHAEELAQQAEAANRAKSEFLANMSHEIRTPMNAVLGYTELLDRKLVDPDLKGYLESIKAGSRSLMTLINDILDLSRIEAGKMRIEFHPMEIRRLLDEVRRIFAVRAQARGLDLVVELTGELPEGMLLDETRLRQVLFNLVGNAIKFTDHGEVRVTARGEKLSGPDDEEGWALVISVSDTGIGIPEDQQRRIFEAFEQQEGQSSRKYGGTGLGLAISRKLARMMGGDLSVSSRIGEGSTFTLRIDGIQVVSTRGGQGEEPEAHYRFQPASILVADDHKTNRQLVRDMVEPEGLMVVEAEDGESALAMAHQQVPDLVLMDIRMPLMDGYAVRQAMLDDPALAEVPVVALTASVMASEASRIREARFDGFLRKPVSRAKLLEELARFLPHQLREEAPEADAGEAESPLTALSREEQQALRAWLLEELGTEREQVRGSGDPEAMAGFAGAVSRVAQERQITELREYAEALQEAISAFDLDRVNDLLDQFPPVPA
ncbi:transporter substrate-binding domain-containing protein [Marinobacteraceae bacterium S3BR75-40.1]